MKNVLKMQTNSIFKFDHELFKTLIKVVTWQNLINNIIRSAGGLPFNFKATKRRWEALTISAANRDFTETEESRNKVTTACKVTPDTISTGINLAYQHKLTQLIRANHFFIKDCVFEFYYRYESCVGG